MLWFQDGYFPGGTCNICRTLNLISPSNLNNVHLNSLRKLFPIHWQSNCSCWLVMVLEDGFFVGSMYGFQFLTEFNRLRTTSSCVSPYIKKGLSLGILSWCVLIQNYFYSEGNNSLLRQKNTKLIIMNYKGTQMIKDGEDWRGFLTNLTNLG